MSATKQAPGTKRKRVVVKKPLEKPLEKPLPEPAEPLTNKTVLVRLAEDRNFNEVRVMDTRKMTRDQVHDLACLFMNGGDVVFNPEDGKEEDEERGDESGESAEKKNKQNESDADGDDGDESDSDESEYTNDWHQRRRQMRRDAGLVGKQPKWWNDFNLPEADRKKVSVLESRLTKEGKIVRVPRVTRLVVNDVEILLGAESGY